MELIEAINEAETALRYKIANLRLRLKQPDGPTPLHVLDILRRQADNAEAAVARLIEERNRLITIKIATDKERLTRG